MKKITLHVYADPGHAWGKVKRSLLVDFMVEHKISHYSYQRRDDVYLEEDCDLFILTNILKFAGVEVIFKEHHTNKQSKIRSYNSFKPRNPAPKAILTQSEPWDNPINVFEKY